MGRICVINATSLLYLSQIRILSVHHDFRRAIGDGCQHFGHFPIPFGGALSLHFCQRPVEELQASLNLILPNIQPKMC